MRITLLALSDWCRLFAFKTGNPDNFFTSLSYWWLTEHDERNMSCDVYREANAKAIEDVRLWDLKVDPAYEQSYTMWAVFGLEDDN